MPSCAVVVCGNRSNNTNLRTCGVTYHRFPKNAEMKEKWIEATGRGDKWFPTQHSVICSSHFEEVCFLPTATSRRLCPTALPTLKLRLVFETPATSSKESIHSKKTIIKRTNKRKIVEKYRVQIQKYKNAMTAQKMQIRRLRMMVRRYRKKLDVMKNIFTALKNENIIGEDHLWLMESDAVTKLKIITPK